MYLHLGNETVIKTDNILGIFDLENTEANKNTLNYFKKAESENRVFNVSNDLPKSFIVCSKKNEPVTIYISRLSSSTLINRLDKQKKPDFGGFIVE